MKYVILFLSLLVLQVLQAGFLDQLGLGPVGNLLLLFITVSVILESLAFGLFLALVSGLMLDFTSGTLDGTLLTAMLLAWVVTYLFIHKTVAGEPNRLILFSAVIFSTLVFALTTAGVNRVMGYFGIDGFLDIEFLLGRKLIADLAANILLSYPVYLYFLGVKRVVRN